MLRKIVKQLLRRAAGAASAPASQWLEQAAALQRDRRHGEAAALCRARLSTDPRDVEALQMLGAALLAQGASAEGRGCLEAAVTHAPQRADLRAQLAYVYSAGGELDLAREAYGAAVALRADVAGWWLSLVALLKAADRYDEAEHRCREALAAIGSSAPLRHALAGVLFEQGRVDDAIEALRASLALRADAPDVHSDLLRALNYSDRYAPEAVFSEHRAWDQQHARGLQSPQPFANTPEPTRRLRVGYVSPYFRKHAVTFFLESVLEHHDGSAVEVLLYADVQRPDEYSERLKSYGAQWRSTVGMKDDAMAAAVRADRIDVLVDLSGHTPGNRLLVFARRPAPVQVTWNGYPNTTGMAAMDYRITDERCDPSGATDRLHTERLVRLPGVYMSWRPPTDAPAPAALAALRAPVTFGSFNSCFKIAPHTISLWSRILHALPHSRLVMLTVTGERAAARILEGFGAQGIAPERIDIRPRVTHEAFLSAHREIDIALDAFPYHGTTTTCFSLWMGVPVVVRVGSTHASRVGLSLLSSVGLEVLAAHDDDAFVETAVALAQDLPALAAMRAGMRERMLGSTLTDGLACARSLEHAYREMWTGWCESGRAAEA
jgi:protein O-GlcNAc transferase